MATSGAGVLPVRGLGGGLLRRLPGLVELALVVGAILLPWPAFERLAQLEPGRDGRFQDIGFRVTGLPEPVLPAVCAAVGAKADVALRDRWCAGRAGDGGTSSALSAAVMQAGQAFHAPVAAAQTRLAELRLRQREGLGELRALSDEAASIDADVQPYVARFQLAGDQGPAPLACAARRLEATAAGDPGHANATMLLAAALDGLPVPEALADAVPLPATAAIDGCGSWSASLSAASARMADARLAALNARKNEAMRALWSGARWQWAGAMALGFVLLLASRSPLPRAAGVSIAMAAWALAAWAARVPWPFGGARSFEPARVDAAWTSAPAGFVIALAAAALLPWLFAKGTRPVAPQAMSSRLGYPGLVLATGVGALLLLELSAHAHPGNRYLALYHQGHLWLAMTVFSVLLFLRQPIARGLAWTLSALGEAARGVRQRLGARRALLLGAVGTGLAVVGAGLALANLRQLTSELGRAWLIVGAAWFFFLRGDPLAERLVRAGAWRYVAPLLFVVAVLVGFMVVTRDMGPLLIAGYGAGAFLAASVAMWRHRRGGSRAAAYALAALLFGAWIGATTVALFRLGEVDAVTAQRLESLAAPLASGNDQLALVGWFQRAAPPDGFGLGAVPWCGHAPSGGCGGVPAQVHSDYSFTALVGVFGAGTAWAAAIACALWLHRLVRHHGRVTRGEPRFVARGDRLAADGQALLSWIALAWVVLTLSQLAVTVAGNLAVLPLTGVTWPFVSFGMTSLVANLAFLALGIQVDLPAEARDG